MSDYKNCVHCGDTCGKYPVVWQNKYFCCEGCKTVYQLLNENQLNNYYDLYKTPGIKAEVKDFGKKYAYLDNEKIVEQLVYFKEGEFSKVVLYIPGIHCSSCIWLLENLFQLNSSISNSFVNFVKKEVDITFRHDDISLREVVELLVSIHYVPMINLKNVEGEKNKTENRTLILKLGVAGFVFGNTMLLSIPEYIPGNDFLAKDFKHFFGYLNLLLALPIIFFAATDYLISAYKHIKLKIINIDLPISIGILAIFFESSYQILSSTGTGYMDSLSGLVFFLLLGKWYQSKTYKALSFERDYKSYFPIAVTKLSDEGEVVIPISDISKGDKIVVHNQELIPADGILRSGEANINYSFVTGESKPVFKRVGEELYAGGKQVGSTIIVEVSKEVMQSKLTQLWNQDFHNSERESISSVIDKVSKYFTFIIIMVAFGAAFYWMFNDSSIAVKVFSSVLIVACPCALALSIPFTFGSIMQLFSRVGFFLKKSDVVENMSNVDTLVFDKTGTITHLDLYSVSYKGDVLTNQEVLYIKSLSRQSKHPLSKCIYESLKSDYLAEIQSYEEVPSLGIKAVFNGVKVKLGSAEFVGKTNKEKHNGSVAYVSVNNVIKGCYVIGNKYREGVGELAHSLQKDFEIHIISGDNQAEKERLRRMFGKNVKLNFNQSPIEKYEYIKNLKKDGKNVMMIGDGLNDAGALKESSFGISIADDIFNFSPASDAILEAKQFYRLKQLIVYSKKGIKIVYVSFAISFMYNIVGLSYAVSGNLSPIIAAVLMPVSSITVVAFVTVATRFMMRKIEQK